VDFVPYHFGAVGLLCLLLLVRDLSRGATRWGGFVVSRREKPALYWGAIGLNAVISIALLYFSVTVAGRE
jgi:hypothetical protein